MVVQEFTAEELALEEWRPFPRYEGYYSVSNLGRVKRDKWERGVKRTGYIKAQSPTKLGYIQVSLSKNSKTNSIHVHSAVAAAFLGPPPPGMETNHKDRDRANNRLENLEYLTRKENIQYSMANRMASMKYGSNHHSWGKPGIRGERNVRSKLTDDIVRQIRKRRSKGETCVQIARDYGVSAELVGQVYNGKIWKHVI